jgi:hypothetical protein
LLSLIIIFIDFFIKGIETYSSDVKKWSCKEMSDFIENIPGCYESAKIFINQV